jgi:ankyrin repeat protein
MVKTNLSTGASINVLDRDGNTPLHIASSEVQYCSEPASGFFRPQCCETLLRLGADLHLVNSTGCTALNLAGANLQMAKILLKHGADVTEGGKGVLSSAIQAGDIEMTRFYLENGADCNVPDTSTGYYSQPIPKNLKRYPLIVAAFPTPYDERCIEVKSDLIKLMLQHGARVDLPISEDQTLIHYIFQYGDSKAIKPFLEHSGLDFNIRDQNGRTVFLAACLSHVRSDSVAGYLKHEETLRLEADYTPSYLLLADSSKYRPTIDYSAADFDGKHLIIHLLNKWQSKLAKRFMSIPGVSDLIHQKDKLGFSPLHHALKHQALQTATELVEAGCDITEPDPGGDNAAHILCRFYSIKMFSENVPLIETFLERGGSINHRNRQGESPLLLYLATGVAPSSDDFDGKRCTHSTHLPLFVSHGADFTAVSNNGQGALHVIAGRDPSHHYLINETSKQLVNYNADLFKEVLEQGCDPLLEDKNGRTALDIAAAMGNEEILKLYQRTK